MDRDEKRSAGAARHADPLGKRDEGIVCARHHHPVFAGLFDAIAQPLGEVEHDVLFQFAAWRLGTRVDTAMTGIERHERSRVAGRGTGIRTWIWTCLAGSWRLGAHRKFVVERDPVQKALAIGRDKIEHQPRRGAVGRIHDKRFLDAHWLDQIEHQTRPTHHDQPETERLDQAPPAFAGLRRQLEGQLGHVDNNPIRVRERKSVQIDLAAEVHDEPRLRFVAAESRASRKRI